ncbi:MAG TPA: ATP-binding protein [Tepidisphaeraceae bacterium]|jgi:two-component system phosphate regulon sensor histidine kinase PhoR|nr:ATP-binding protein [Tepidisphaeraceae bacterium]
MNARSSVFRQLLFFVIVSLVCGGALRAVAAYERRQGFTESAYWLTAIIVGLVVTGIWFAWRHIRWTRPVDELNRAMDQLTEGDWKLRAAPQGAPELQQMAGRLNDLARQVRTQLSGLRMQRADLQTLVDTLPDSIITTDATGRIVLINQPASQLLSVAVDMARGMQLVAVVHDNAIVELFDAAIQNAHDPLPASEELTAALAVSRSVQRTMQLMRSGQRLTFQAFATRTAGGGVLLVLRDITQLSATVQMKTDFVANASHELRTPLAAIKMAFETLREVYDDDAKQTMRCINIIEGHLNRLEEMLRDLLDLSRVESPDLKPQLQRVKTVDVFTLLRSGLGAFAREKLVELKLADSPDTPAAFETDERLLNLVLKNLVENSIKFTPPGGSVTLEFRQSGDETRISVIDTGIGIPPEHVERVFERFYQVDPARSGSAGRGTGLGLAIVKHAVAGLGGALSLRSKVGVGTTVTVALHNSAPADMPMKK